MGHGTARCVTIGRTPPKLAASSHLKICTPPSPPPSPTDIDIATALAAALTAAIRAHLAATLTPHTLAAALEGTSATWQYLLQATWSTSSIYVMTVLVYHCTAR